MKSAGPQRGVIAQSCGLDGEEVLQNFACFAPGRPAQSEKSIKRIAAKDRAFAEIQGTEIAAFLEDGEVEHEVANRHPGAGRTVVRLKNSIGQILEREMRFRCDLDEGLKWFGHGIKESRNAFSSRSSEKLGAAQGRASF